MARPIDADDLMNGLNRKKAGPHDRKYTEGFNDALMRFRSMVHSAPTISADDARGVAKVKYDHGDYSCSACGHPARRLSFARKNYCDECGAKLLWEVSEDVRL